MIKIIRYDWIFKLNSKKNGEITVLEQLNFFFLALTETINIFFGNLNTKFVFSDYILNLFLGLSTRKKYS